MSRRQAILASCIFFVAVFASSPLLASEASLDEVALLAETATTDDTAASQLARVTSIDGVPVDMGTILEGSNEDVARRLDTIAALRSNPTGSDAAAARADAAAILAGDEFQPVDLTPHPATRIGEWLADLVPDQIGQALSSRGLWILLALVLVAAVLFSWVRGGRRHLSGRQHTWVSDERDRPRRAEDIEARAREAAANGDYSSAVRLWFEGGAVRLADAGVVSNGPTSTSGAIRRAVPSATMAMLANTFDRVAYGGRAANREDAQAAEHGWTAVRSEAGRHG